MAVATTTAATARALELSWLARPAEDAAEVTSPAAAAEGSAESGDVESGWKPSISPRDYDDETRPAVTASASRGPCTSAATSTAVAAVSAVAAYSGI